MKEIKTLAMIKMEKNFRAHIEKKYPRHPYKIYDMDFWIQRIEQELNELKEAYANKDYDEIREELADISNLVDFAFERTFIEESHLPIKTNFPSEDEIGKLFTDARGHYESVDPFGKKQLNEYNKPLEKSE